MMASNNQNSAAPAEEIWIGIKEVMVSSKITKSKIRPLPRPDSDFFNIGIKEVMVVSKIKISAAAAAELWIVNFGIKEVLVVKK